MHAVRKAAEGAAGDGQEDPGALVVAAVGEGRADDKEQGPESVRQEVHGGESAGEGAGTYAAEYRQQAHDGGGNHGDQLAAELPVANHHAANIFEAGAGGLSTGLPSRQAGDGADQVVGGGRGDAEDDPQHGDRAESRGEAPERGRMSRQSTGYVQGFEGAAKVARQQEK